MTLLGFAKDTRGAAAAEFVLWLAVLTLPIASAVDVGYFAFQKMQVDIASQAAVQAIWRLCDTPAKLEAATENCEGLAAAATAGAQSTKLGAAVTVASGSPLDGYMCPHTDNTLKPAGTGMTWTLADTPPSKKPNNCAAVTTGSKTSPGEYVSVTVNYSFAPIFAYGPMAAVLPSTITRTAWVRLI